MLQEPQGEMSKVTGQGGRGKADRKQEAEGKQVIPRPYSKLFFSICEGARTWRGAVGRCCILSFCYLGSSSHPKPPPLQGQSLIAARVTKLLPTVNNYNLPTIILMGFNTLFPSNIARTSIFNHIQRQQQNQF